ncbi:MAG: alpha/beta hydrolase [Micrococcales bacterium]|nr:alpha/beta hydrolase [Micrococcales bacterium]
MKEHPIEIPGYDGTVSGTVAIPDHSTSSSVYILSHGITTGKDEYLDFYRKVASGLAAYGHASIRIDHRGHGQSSFSSQDLNLFNMTQDLVASAEWATEHLGSNSVVAVGTSFGAPSAIMLGRLMPQVKAVGLIAPVTDLLGLYVEPADRDRRERYAGIIDLARGATTPIVLDERIAVGPRLAFEFITINLDTVIGALAQPVLIMHGTLDGAIPVEHSRRLARVHGGVRLIEFEGMEHGFTEVGDETGMNPGSIANLQRIVDSLASLA